MPLPGELIIELYRLSRQQEYNEKSCLNGVSEINCPSHAVVSTLGGAIAIFAHTKISGDHDVYASFGAEYVKTSERLGLYANSCVTLNDGQTIVQPPIKTNRSIGQGAGYRKTQIIIWIFAGVLVLFSLLYAITVSCIFP